MQHSKSVKDEAERLVQAMRRACVPAFMPEVFGLEQRELVENMVANARQHCRIQERWCSEEMDAERSELVSIRESSIEGYIRAAAISLGLRAHFDGDPRGFTVKLHAPTGDAFNTWGGKESGYGIGETS